MVSLAVDWDSLPFNTPSIITADVSPPIHTTSTIFTIVEAIPTAIWESYDTMMYSKLNSWEITLILMKSLGEVTKHIW